MTKTKILGLLTGCLTVAGFAPAAFAQGDTQQCARFQTVIQSPAPTIGALASLEHSVAVMKAAIGMIDLPCGAPYIVSTDEAAIAQQRAELYAAWRQARANCLQLTSGAGSYDQLPDTSACKEEVSAR